MDQLVRPLELELTHGNIQQHEHDRQDQKDHAGIVFLVNGLGKACEYVDGIAHDHSASVLCQKRHQLLAQRILFGERIVLL